MLASNLKLMFWKNQININSCCFIHVAMNLGLLWIVLTRWYPVYLVIILKKFLFCIESVTLSNEIKE